MVGDEHSSFNSAIFQAAGSMAKDYGYVLHFWGDRCHYEVISRGKEDLCTFHPATVVPGAQRKFFSKILRELQLILRVLRYAQEQRACVLFLSVFSATQPFLFLMRPFFRKVNVSLCLHGELDGLWRPDRQSLLSYGFWVKLALLRLHIGNWPRLFVLGKGIRERLLAMYPREASLEAIGVIEHPLQDSAISFRGEHNGVLRVGFIGNCRPNKGINALHDLAEALAPHLQNGLLELYLVGSIASGCALSGAAEKHVCVLGDGKFLSMEDYRAHIAQLSVAVFFFGNNYQFTASGSLFDAIAAGVRVFSLDNPYVIDVMAHDSEHGIEVFPDTASMARRLQELCSENPQQRFNYDGVRRIHGTHAVKAFLENDILELQRHEQPAPAEVEIRLS
jgi:glycosyltransferase involved in cell wall biosynthesis